MAGMPLTVNIYVDDLRDGGAGVFASYVDIFYPGRLISVDGEITFDDEYHNGVNGEVVPSGLIDEVGAFAGLDEQPTDVNDDGFTTALDALQCINTLNDGGSRTLARYETRGDTSPDRSIYVDVNGDFDLLQEDALIIVNQLNLNSRDFESQPTLVRQLAAWVDWEKLDAAFNQEAWVPLGGVGLDTHDMLDLTREIFRDQFFAHVSDTTFLDDVLA